MLFPHAGPPPHQAGAVDLNFVVRLGLRLCHAHGPDRRQALAGVLRRGTSGPGLLGLLAAGGLIFGGLLLLAHSDCFVLIIISLDTVVARDQKNEQVYEDTEESVAPQKCGKDAEKVDVEQVILGVEVQ